MIPLDVDIFVALEPIDLRRSFDLLAGAVRERLAGDPKSGAIFLFFSKRRDRMKALFYDKTGYCILYKRLDRGTFRLPERLSPDDTSVCLPEDELAVLLDGMAPERSGPPKRRLH